MMLSYATFLSVPRGFPPTDGRFARGRVRVCCG
jgi:hypothetical protein